MTINFGKIFPTPSDVSHFSFHSIGYAHYCYNVGFSPICPLLTLATSETRFQWFVAPQIIN